MIPPEQLALRVGDIGFVFGRPIRVYQRYEVYHKILGDVIDSGTVQTSVPLVRELNVAGDRLNGMSQSAFSDVLAKHEPLPPIGGHSAFDADLILDEWEFDGQTMEHPISGSFPFTGNSMVERVNGVLSNVPPPTTWFWADGRNPLELWVKCVAVNGADSYNVYNEGEFLDNVNDHTWHILSVPAGEYSVRMAAVKNGVVGVLSFPVFVQVFESGGEAAAMGGGDLAMGLASAETPELRKVWRKVFYA